MQNTPLASRTLSRRAGTRALPVRGFSTAHAAAHGQPPNEPASFTAGTDKLVCNSRPFYRLIVDDCPVWAGKKSDKRKYSKWLSHRNKSVKLKRQKAISTRQNRAKKEQRRSSAQRLRAGQFLFLYPAHTAAPTESYRSIMRANGSPAANVRAHTRLLLNLLD